MFTMNKKQSHWIISFIDYNLSIILIFVIELYCGDFPAALQPVFFESLLKDSRRCVNLSADWLTTWGSLTGPSPLRSHMLSSRLNLSPWPRWPSSLQRLSASQQLRMLRRLAAAGLSIQIRSFSVLKTSRLRNQGSWKASTQPRTQELSGCEWDVAASRQSYGVTQEARRGTLTSCLNKDWAVERRYFCFFCLVTSSFVCRAERSNIWSILGEPAALPSWVAWRHS